MGIRKHRVWNELPAVTPNADTQIIVTDNDGKYLGYASVADLQVTVDGDGLATDADITALSASIAEVASTISGGGDVEFNTVHATINGTGTNFKIGDDAYIGDVNLVNGFAVKGQADGSKGYIQFGSGSNMPKIGGGGANHLNIANIPAYANNAAALSGGLLAGDIYRNGDNLGIVH
jgi:hypothetical protein